jgi:uncharacterized protein
MLLSELNIDVEGHALEAFCRAHGVAKLSLFGSSLRDDFQPEHSDVDLLVEFSAGEPRNLFKLVRMENELRQLFGRDVDLTTAGSLSKYFRDDVLASAVVLYDAA